MNILITGGAGFIGSHIAETLIENHHNVTILDNLSTGNKKFIPEGAEFINDDIRSSSIESLFRSRHFDAVYHEAAQLLVPVSIADPKFDADENIMGMLNILEAARKNGVRKIIFSSSAAVYGDNPNLPLTETEPPEPASPYGLTKWMTENYLKLYHRLYGLNYTILRYSNVYGPRQGSSGEGGVIYHFAKALAKGEPVTIYGDGKATRDFIFVRDVAAANLEALDKADNRIMNISSNSEISIHDLALRMIRISGKTVPVIYKPARAGDILHSRLSNEEAEKRMKWTPRTSVDIGLESVNRYFENNG